MLKRISYFVLLCSVLSFLIIGSVSAANLFSETFGIETDWTTDLPVGWTASNDDTSGMDDQLSTTGGSDGNRYAWLIGDSEDQHIERAGISTSGYQNIKISFYYNLVGSFASNDLLVVEWKETSNGGYETIHSFTGVQGWNQVMYNLPPDASDTTIDLRFRAQDTESSDFILIDDVTISGILIANCGNYIIENTEECDDGPFGSEQCTLYCTLTFCGDGVTQHPNGQGTAGENDDGIESCDDGNLVNDDNCDNNCRSTTQGTCGDGNVNQGEQCDDGDTSSGDGCDENCQVELELPVCGDGDVEGIEECEYPSTTDNSYCTQTTTDCDGHKQGTRDSEGDCDSDCYCDYDSFIDYQCIPGACGAQCDGDLDCSTNEVCNLDTCLCEPEEYCGDGTVTGSEECEYPSTTDNAYCTQSQTNCVGYKQGVRDAYGNCNLECNCNYDAFTSYECNDVCGAPCDEDSDCDDQNSGTTDSCNMGSCTCVFTPIAVCGNGIVEPGEECDDGNDGDNNDECLDGCIKAYCGDWYTWTGIEECDDGNFDNYDACTDSCIIAECGDTYIYYGVEECDDGNLVNGDGCDENCSIEVDEICVIPVDAMLVIDRSGSMVGERLSKAKIAAKTFVGLLNDTKDMAGLTSFSELGYLDEPLTFNYQDVKDAIDDLVAGGRTNLGSGIHIAQLEIGTNGRADTPHVMVILSDGAPNLWGEDYPPNSCPEITPNASNNCTDYALQQATLAKNNGTIIFAIGLGINPGSFTEQLLKDITSSPDNYFLAPTADDLLAIYLEIAEILCPCGDGVLGPGEECDDGDDDNYDECTNECKLPVCGDEYVYYNDTEECELPGTTNNVDCMQTTFECLGAKAGTRDLFGDCIAGCLCDPDPFVYECVIGECGAQCAEDNDCDDQNASTTDSCNPDTCQCEYSFCGDGIQDPGEECDDGNSNPYDLCANDCTLTYCGDFYLQQPNGVGTDGPFNDGYEDCDDGNDGDNNDECLDGCIDASCGDGYIWTGFEECELPGSINNINCPQTPQTDCDGHKQGTRDAYGDCDLICGCDEDPFTDYQCNPPACGAQCDEDTDCSQTTQECEGEDSNKTGIRDAYGTCEDDCLCTYDPFDYVCITDSCGAQCGSDDDCDDGNGATIDTCNLNSCSCEHRFIELIKKDSKVAQAMPNSNFGLGRYMIVNPKTAGTDRSYIRIDVSPLSQNASSAVLKIAVYYTGNNVIGSLIDAYYCPDHDFDETGIKWNNQVFDGECVLADTYNITNKVIAGSPETWHEFDLTDEVNDEISSGDGLFTVVLRHRDEGSVSDNSKYVQYLTKEYPDENYRPKLDIS